MRIHRTVFGFPLVGALACGCGASPAPRSPAPSGGNTTAAAASVRGAEWNRLCERARTFAAQQCAPYDSYGPALDHCDGVSAIYMSGIQDCTDEPTCEEAQTCIRHVLTEGATYRGPTTPCSGQTDTSLPAGVSAADFDASYGRKDRRFSDSSSSRDRPIEACGLQGELDYLLRVTCDDGSHPFTSRAAAEESRVGNVGYGGRCNRVIDHYAPRCPEKTYDVFIDAYRCPVGVTVASASASASAPPAATPPSAPQPPATASGSSSRPTPRILPTVEPLHGAIPQKLPACVAHYEDATGDRFRKVTAGWPGQNDSMAIMPGETFCLKADEIDGRVVNFEPAPAGYPEAKTLSVKLVRSENGGLVLAIKNPMSRWLHFEATLMRNEPFEITPVHLSLVGPGNTNMEIFKPVEMDFMVLGKASLTDAPPNAPPTAADAR